MRYWRVCVVNSTKCASTLSISEMLLSRIKARHLSQAPSRYPVVLLRGDGIGPECISATCEIIDAAGVSVDWKEYEFGQDFFLKTGKFLDEHILSAFDETRVIFKGPITIPPKVNPKVEIQGRKFTSANQALRKLFNLFANVRPSRTLPGVRSRFDNVDLVVIRENTEDLYTGEERWVDQDTVEGIKRISRNASSNIAKFAFDYAQRNNRKHVTAVHKANVCPLADGLFLECSRKVAADYKNIKYSEQLADSLLTKLVLDASISDILLCPNLFGDLISDLGAGLTGSLGLACSGMYGPKHALFEPAHGSAPDIAGKGIANPTSHILSATMMLRHLGEISAAERIDAALMKALQNPAVTTQDVGGQGSTKSFTNAIIELLE